MQQAGSHHHHHHTTTHYKSTIPPPTDASTKFGRLTAWLTGMNELAPKSTHGAHKQHPPQSLLTPTHMHSRTTTGAGAKFGWRTAWLALMNELAPQSKDGAYKRPGYMFQGRIGDVNFPVSSLGLYMHIASIGMCRYSRLCGPGARPPCMFQGTEGRQCQLPGE